MLPSHGSNPHYLYDSLSIAQPEETLDFSANLNPFGPPKALIEKWPDAFNLITTYPDPHASSLTKKLAAMHDTEESHVLVGNGGAELITLVGRFLFHKRVCIVQPAFSEYEEACRSAGCEITYHMLEEGWRLDPNPLIEIMNHLDAIFLCTPNNPTGVSYDAETVRTLIAEADKRACYLIIDEAFADFLQKEPCYTVEILTNKRLIILRSLTKMFAIPGLRLGYMMAHPEVIRTVKKLKPHWSVNALALMAGEICIEEQAYMTLTRKFIEEEREKLQTFFEKHRYIYSRSSVNFYLLKDPEQIDQAPLLLYLMKNGIVPRHTENFPGLNGRWLRFAIRTSDENDRLMEVLASWRR
ncbi:threonine-phosphate decarboxylase [Alkalihalobacillus hwajinpoensis]|uniref:threonine-phosphate decarboxylase CobD n=1 Tax=Guptibacillus hwajinpoensis TaxID=208199 RepID=UPI0018842A9D|nr:threonine-phosphate decarboxylase CobD [Pseudalkalibacillus hwajinpoensis]MBF0705336.1 threonine-phosphate decarboxylase [Pseudalkalibacillus hwajinpoensis]